MNIARIKYLASKIKDIYQTQYPAEILNMRGVQVLPIEFSEVMDYIY